MKPLIYFRQSVENNEMIEVFQEVCYSFVARLDILYTEIGLSLFFQ